MMLTLLYLFTKLFIITLTVTFIIDYAGFVDEIITKLHEHKIMVSRQIKPFTCSLCCSFWVMLLYVIIISQFSFLSLGMIVILSSSTKLLARTLQFIFR